MSVEVFQAELDPEYLYRKIRDEGLKFVRAVGLRYPNAPFEDKMNLSKLCVLEAIERSEYAVRKPQLVRVLMAHEQLLGIPEGLKLVSPSKDELMQRLERGAPEMYFEALSIHRPDPEVSTMLRAMYLSHLGPKPQEGEAHEAAGEETAHDGPEAAPQTANAGAEEAANGQP